MAYLAETFSKLSGDNVFWVNSVPKCRFHGPQNVLTACLARYPEKQSKKHLKKAIQTPTEKPGFVVEKSQWHRVRSRLFFDVGFDGEVSDDGFIESGIVHTHRKGRGGDKGKYWLFVLVFDGQTGGFK